MKMEELNNSELHREDGRWIPSASGRPEEIQDAVRQVGETGPILDTVPCWTGALKIEK